MKILPSSGDAWYRSVLFPFKVYVVAVFVVLGVYSAGLPGPKYTDEMPFLYAIMGYVICFAALAIGGGLQRYRGSKHDSLVSWGFAGAAALLGTLLVPSLAK